MCTWPPALLARASVRHVGETRADLWTFVHDRKRLLRARLLLMIAPGGVTCLLDGFVGAQGNACSSSSSSSSSSGVAESAVGAAGSAPAATSTARPSGSSPVVMPPFSGFSRGMDATTGGCVVVSVGVVASVGEPLWALWSLLGPYWEPLGPRLGHRWAILGRLGRC